MPTTKKNLKSFTRTKNANELAEAMGLSPVDGLEIEFSVELNDKIIQVVTQKNLTHSEVSQLTGIGRTKVTAIMNRNLHEISIKTLIRVLGGLGYKVSPKISKVA